jgi:YesN/AraC family two-component response regulator
VDTLSILLADFCPEVEIMEKCMSAKKGLEAIERLKPELVFLDIEMPIMNGFELLEQFKEIPFSVIFTTSYDQYAIKAIRFSALDYLLKPIDPKELIAAVHKVQLQKSPPSSDQLRMLMDHIQGKENEVAKLTAILNPYRRKTAETDKKLCPVKIEYHNAQGQASMMLGDAWRVELHDELLQNLTAWVSKENVKILYN